MDLNPDELQALDDLREVARRYCAEIETAHKRTPIEFLRCMNRLLPDLYWRASLLSELDPWAHEADEPDIVPMIDAAQDNDPGKVRQASLRISQSLRERFGHLDSYRSTVDPFSITGDGEGWISNDLTDIYIGLHRNLTNDIRSDESESERHWHWRFAFVHHWGVFHLPPTLHAISWLVHQHWDEDDGKWDDEFLSQRRPGHNHE